MKSGSNFSDDEKTEFVNSDNIFVIQQRLGKRNLSKIGYSLFRKRDQELSDESEKIIKFPKT